jgi:putative transposase
MPTPKSLPIQVSNLQKRLLEVLSRQSTASIRDVERSRLILAMSNGLANTKAAESTGLSKEQAQRWRRRWISFQDVFIVIEDKGGENVEWEMRHKILECLSDAVRPGAPYKFTSEQYCQIVAIAIEQPKDSGRPVSEWTPRELADEAKKRGIVESISISQVSVFLKGERRKAAQD